MWRHINGNARFLEFAEHLCTHLISLLAESPIYTEHLNKSNRTEEFILFEEGCRCIIGNIGISYDSFLCESFIAFRLCGTYLSGIKLYAHRIYLTKKSCHRATWQKQAIKEREFRMRMGIDKTCA